MQKFQSITGIAAYLPRINVDTDMIIPKHFLKTIQRSGLGKGLFFELRYTSTHEEIAEFVLNRAGYQETKILITGINFGCGSSREHAVWALLDFGIRCVIAPSFGDIFFQNCFKNSLLPIVLPQPLVESLGNETQDHVPTYLTVDLQTQQIQRQNGESIRFSVDPFHKDCLLKGLDEIALTLEHNTQIERFEARQRVTCPWLWTRG